MKCDTQVCDGGGRLALRKAPDTRNLKHLKGPAELRCNLGKVVLGGFTVQVAFGGKFSVEHKCGDQRVQARRFGGLVPLERRGAGAIEV